MESATLVSLLPELENFLRRLDDCFVRKEQRDSLRAYIRGQLSDLPRKSIEPMALACGLPPRNLQQFLSLHGWDEAMVRDRVQQVIHYHRANIAASKASHAKRRKRRLRQAGVALGQCTHCEKVAL